MDRLQSLKVISAIAEVQSFITVARRMNMSRAMVSKHVQAIEAQLGARLFNRTSRAVSLTEAGRIYLDRVMPLLDGLDEAEATLRASAYKPNGVLRVALPVWMNNAAFVKMLLGFHHEYPDVKLDLNLSGWAVNFVEDQIDLALRVSRDLNENLIARKLGDINFTLVATPDFLDRFGRPETTEMLVDAPFIVYSRVIKNGRLHFGDKIADLKVDPVLTSDNDILNFHAVRQGMGFAILPNFLVDDDIENQTLEPVLQDIIRPAAPIYAVYPERKFLPAKVRCFLDYLTGPKGLMKTV